MENIRYMPFDTETTGLFDFKKRAHEEGQPRLASITIMLTDDQANVEQTISDLIRPDGWSMTDPDKRKAAEINGLSDEILFERGVPVDAVLEQYQNLIDQGYIPVAFNAQFDTKVMRGEMRRAGMKDMFEATPNICVMQAMAEIMYDEGAHNSSKRVSLDKACAFIGYDNKAPHTARGDTEAVVAIMKYLIGRGDMPEPAVKYAKRKGDDDPLANLPAASSEASGDYSF